MASWPASVPVGSAVSEAGGAAVARLMEVMARLRAEDGCPWDRQQTWRSLRRHVLEEAHELVDAIDRNDPEAVREECGDLLLEVVFVARIASEEGRFGMVEVAAGITEKLIRRHPHVFGEAKRAADAGEALESWEAVKARERADRPRPGGGALPALPALLLAIKVLESRRAARGRQTDPDGPGSPPGASRRSLPEFLARLEAAHRKGDPDLLEHRLGDLLFAVAGVAHRSGLDPEAALRNAARRAAAEV